MAPCGGRDERGARAATGTRQPLGTKGERGGGWPQWGVNCEGRDPAGATREDLPGWRGAEEGPCTCLFTLLEGVDPGRERWTGEQDPGPGGACILFGGGGEREA